MYSYIPLLTDELLLAILAPAHPLYLHRPEVNPWDMHRLRAPFKRHLTIQERVCEHADHTEHASLVRGQDPARDERRQVRERDVLSTYDRHNAARLERSSGGLERGEVRVEERERL
jgi:hypothetical protein